MTSDELEKRACEFMTRATKEIGTHNFALLSAKLATMLVLAADDVKALRAENARLKRDMDLRDSGGKN